MMNRLLVTTLIFVYPLGQAIASERSDYMNCHASIERYSKGPSQDIGPWEQWSADSHARHTRSTLAVPGVLGRVEGVYFYTDEGAYFAPKPSDRDTRIFGFHYDLQLPNRFPFRCHTTSKAESWADVQAKRYQKVTQCWLFNEHAPSGHSFRRVRPRQLSIRENPDGALRTVVSMRISSVVAEFRREVESYRENLAAYLRSRNATGMGASLRSLAGWAPKRPYPPSPDRLIRALNACANSEDETLRHQANAVKRLLEMTPIPTEASVASACTE